MSGSNGNDRMERLRGRNAVLDWLARARIAGVKPMAVGLGITPRRVRVHAESLEADGLVVRSQLGDGGGGVLVVTARGVRAAGYKPNSHTTTRSITGLLHGRGVSWVAAHCELRGRPWYGPGDVRSEDWVVKLPPKAGPGARTHAADLGFILDGERWAVEFERTPKPRPRLRRILEGYRRAQLSGQIDAVLYVCDDEWILDLVESTAAEVKLHRAVRDLGWVISEATKQPVP